MTASILLLTAYFLTRFAFNEALEAVSIWIVYGIDIAFVLLVLSVWGKKPDLRIPGTRRVAVEALAALLAGASAFFVARQAGLSVPFALDQLTSLMLLGVVAPVLEELVFREAMWQPVHTFLSKVIHRHARGLTLLALAAIFSYAHFDAYFWIPAEYQPFILWQTLYTFLAGLWWAKRYAETGSLGLTILLHFCFNTGFYLGWLLA